MEIHSGKLFKNKTWRYLYPTLKYYGPDLDNYITSFIKLSIGIGDTKLLKKITYLSFLMLNLKITCK